MEEIWKCLPHTIRCGYTDLFDRYASRKAQELDGNRDFENCSTRKGRPLVEGFDEYYIDAPKKFLETDEIHEKFFSLIDITFFSKDGGNYEPGLRKKVVHNLYAFTVCTAEKHQGTLLWANPSGFRILFNAFTAVEKHVNSAIRCAVAILHHLRTESLLFTSTQVSWLIVIHGGEGSAGVIGDSEFIRPCVCGDFVRNASELLGLHRLYSERLLWTSYIHEQSTGILFDRLVGGILLLDDTCELVYEIVESLDYIPLENYNRAVSHLIRNEFVQALESLRMYTQSNEVLQGDHICETLVDSAKLKKP
eukprot:CAMPEP_0201532310 /NCGR_PEP_ID=MMETSP0161_2-20130828/50034_1 /ASSEMBLY_ACC=CAM_ASM_000251 /TAXON_ID=180227 /ORGANISM="Neoparamoeba aestuarina, Strain SoJaBio B1-5/56/2" /LENGTH=306 /DNA_ID=CAMNT_0047935649 /DNA_START=307 /DNA_END=1223 /DNA_ORIENTATION=+